VTVGGTSASRRAAEVAALIAIGVLAATGTRLVGAEALQAVGQPAQVARPTAALSPSSSATPPASAEQPTAPTEPAVAEPLPPTASSTPKIVAVEDIAAALLRQSLARVDALAGYAVDGPEEYMSPGDSVPSARLVGGAMYLIDTRPDSAIFVEILLFEGAQDASAHNAQDLVLGESAGEPFDDVTIDGNAAHCRSNDASECLATIGRAALRTSSVEAADLHLVEAAMLAAMRTLAAARAEAAGG
jgi:hypothetical protein